MRLIRKNQSGQAMVEAMLVAGILIFVMVGFGYMISAFMDHGFRSYRLISLNIN
jgi:hypothetical protein